MCIIFNDKKYQGISHILAILFIPGILVSHFLIGNYYLTVGLVLLLILVLIVIFKRKK